MKREVKDQVRLSFTRSVEFCISSIRHRFFRSAVTLSVIVLAVAFLMNILTESIISNGVAVGVGEEFKALYAADLFDRRISRVTPLISLAQELSELPGGSPRHAELQGWSALTADEFQGLALRTKQEVQYAAFFEQMDFGRRRKLVKRNDGVAIFDYLAEPAQFDGFAETLRLPEMASITVPEDVAGLKGFAHAWPLYRKQLSTLKDNSVKALKQVDSALKAPLEKTLSEENAAAVHAALTTVGFRISRPELDAVLRDRKTLGVARKFREYAADAEFRNEWPDLKTGEDFTPETVLRRYLDEPRVREWVVARATIIAARLVGPLPVSKDELADIGARYRAAVEKEGRSKTPVADVEINKSPAQRNFLEYIKRPQFAAAWKQEEAFSAEALLWSYEFNEKTRKWLGDVAKEISDPLPCSRDDVKALSSRFRNLTERRGLAGAPFAQFEGGTGKIAALQEYLSDPEFRRKWDDLNINLDYSTGALVLYCSGDERAPQVLAYVEGISRKLATRIKAPLPASEAELLAVADLERNRAQIRTMQSGLTARGASGKGLSERTFWLVVVSFLVCVVGIANAMLMAVTERFREIATMKCLGSLDEFIMTIFLIESGLQGLIGAVFGVVLGLLLALARCGNWYGMYTFYYFPIGQVALNMFVSMAAGMLLAMLAAVYPAWVASRMAPMEAMRVE